MACSVRRSLSFSRSLACSLSLGMVQPKVAASTHLISNESDQRPVGCLSCDRHAEAEAEAEGEGTMCAMDGWVSLIYRAERSS